MRKNEKGFSFIELIVVVTIILVLTVAGTVSYQGASRRSRDSRRMSDLQKLAISLEVYKQEEGTYPGASGGMPANLVELEYIQELPSDPKADFNYLYNPGTNSYSYALYAQMEDSGSENYTGTEDCGGGSGTCNYRLLSP